MCLSGALLGFAGDPALSCVAALSLLQALSQRPIGFMESV